MIKCRMASAKHAFTDQAVSNDIEGRIKGTTKKQGVSISCLVRVYEKSSGRLIDQQLSDQYGFYQFMNLKKSAQYLILGFDPNQNFNAVIQDNVVPK